MLNKWQLWLFLFSKANHFKGSMYNQECEGCFCNYMTLRIYICRSLALSTSFSLSYSLTPKSLISVQNMSSFQVLRLWSRGKSSRRNKKKTINEKSNLHRANLPSRGWSAEQFSSRQGPGVWMNATGQRFITCKAQAPHGGHMKNADSSDRESMLFGLKYIWIYFPLLGLIKKTIFSKRFNFFLIQSGLCLS